MTFTFKLARRLAASRAVPCVLTCLAVACGSGNEPLSPTANTPNAAPRTVLTPRQSTLEVDQALRFAAYRSQGGDSAPAARVVWSASGGAIDSTGVFQAVAAGTYHIVGRIPEGDAAPDTALVTVVEKNAPAASAPQPPALAGANAYPHMPAGFSVVADNDGSTLPPAAARTGSWWTSAEVNRGKLTLAADASGPQSPGSVIRTLFPAGMNSGVEPVDWGVAFLDRPRTKLYFSMWLKINGRDYENQATAGTKLGFFGYGEGAAGAWNQGYFILAATGSQAPGTNFAVHFVQQNNVDRRLTPNVGSLRLSVGGWHHFEAVLELNAVGHADGVFQFWLDGVETMRYRDVSYATPGAAAGFYSWKWRPTWGGSGGRRTRDDVMLIDHVYIAGQ